MMHYARPPRPPRFAASIAAARQRVAADRRARRSPTFRPSWRAHKSAFAIAQHGKCGYCEARIAAGQAGDVEHFAPKAAVAVLSDDPAHWGVEEPGLSRLVRRSRRTRRISSTGYWWLAYDWHNFVFACAVCNQTYKGDCFPIHPTPRRGWRPSPRGRPWSSLLLGCFDDRAPWRHFRFDRTGAVSATSARGAQTLRVCGLFRSTLARDRRLRLELAHALCERIVADPAALHAWLDLRRIGRPEQAFAGAVRSLTEDVLGVRWDDLDAYVDALASQESKR